MKCLFTGKVRHHSRKAADLHIESLKRWGKDAPRTRPYRCWRCGGWHIGFGQITDGDRITELLRRAKERAHRLAP